MPARSLGDEQEQIGSADPPPPKARVAYLIMTSGIEELRKTKRLLKVCYIGLRMVCLRQSK